MPASTPAWRRQALSYLLAPLSTAVALAATRAVQPVLGPVLLPFFLLAIAVATLYGGRGPGALAALLSLAALRYVFLVGAGGVGRADDLDRLRVLSFLIVAIPFVWLAGSVHAQRRRLAEQAAENERLRRLAEQEAGRSHESALAARLASRDAAEALVRRELADTALRASEAQLADFFQTASIGLHWVGPDGTILRANQAELDLLGYERDEYVGHHVAEFHADRSVIDDMLRRLLAGERLQQYSARLRCKNGEIKHVRMDSSGYFVDGQFVHTRCFTRDVTSEKLAGDAAARLAAIVASSSDAIVGKTLDGVVTSWNAAAERIFGYPAGEMVGQSIFKLIPPELHDLERDVLDRVRRGEAVEIAESERVRRDGRRIWISLSVSPIRDGAGVVTGAASIKRDVTERRRMEEHLRDTQRLQAVGQLAGGMAHEANNQMSVVLGGAHFLLARRDLPEDMREDLEHIRRAAERTALVTQQLLAFGRRQFLQPQELDLNEVVRSIVPVLQRSLAEDQELVVRLGALSARVVADPRQLEQVLLNLALNGRDAMPDGGRLTIGTREVRVAEGDGRAGGPPPGAYDVLVVEDTGHGMDAATRERAFEPFFTTKEVGQGSGLGLSVVHGIVSQSGGHIQLESRPGHGTTFRLFFPLVQPADRAGRSAPEPRSRPAAGTLVLLVEDDPLVRAMASRALGEGGYAVLEAPHGRAALDLLRQHDGHPGLVLTDIGMPEMDGYELARRLGEEHPELPVVFMSGYGNLDDRGRPAPRAVQATIRKPFSPESLVRAVGEVLARQGGAAAGNRSALDGVP
jgi:PAS domain S-box-containing protein